MKIMKWFVFGFVLSILATGCENSEESEVSLRSVEYYLYRAGFEPVKGVVTFTEVEPGKIEVFIELENTPPEYNFPAHLHFGTIREVGELAFRLEDVDGSTGQSLTVLDRVTLSDGEVLTFDLLQEINGSVKIHLNDGLFKNQVLSYGNIGANENYLSDGVAVCVGH
jgi:hypothetical protein